jgi:hypothetical protein
LEVIVSVSMMVAVLDMQRSYDAVSIPIEFERRNVLKPDEHNVRVLVYVFASVNKLSVGPKSKSEARVAPIG